MDNKPEPSTKRRRRSTLAPPSRIPKSPNSQTASRRQAESISMETIYQQLTIRNIHIPTHPSATEPTQEISME